MASLDDLLASEARDYAIYSAYKADKRVLRHALVGADLASLAALAKFVPMSTIAAAEERSGAAFPPELLPSLALACAQDQRRFDATCDACLLIHGDQPPAQYWLARTGAPLRACPRRQCYMCREPFFNGQQLGDWRPTDGGHASLCFACGVRNLEARQLTADLAGWRVLLTGCRHTVGYAMALRLLRLGATVLGTTRFPAAALLNFAAEPDFEHFKGRLSLLACNFLDPAQVEALARCVEHEPPDVYISNAFMTVEQSDHYYQTLLGIEEHMLAHTPLPGSTCSTAPSNAIQAARDTHACAGTHQDIKSTSAAAANTLALSTEPALTHSNQLPANVPGMLVHAAAPGVQAGVVATAAWLADQGLLLNEHGNLQEAPRTTMWTQTLAQTPAARIAESTVVNQLAPTLLLQRVQAAMLACPNSQGVLINVTSTEHLHRCPAHAITGMHKAAMEVLWEKLALERDPRLMVYSADPGFVTGVVGAQQRKPLTAADGAARVLHPLLAVAGAADPLKMRARLSGVLVWKDFVPFKVLRTRRREYTHQMHLAAMS